MCALVTSYASVIRTLALAAYDIVWYGPVVDAAVEVGVDPRWMGVHEPPPPEEPDELPELPDDPPPPPSSPDELPESSPEEVPELDPPPEPPGLPLEDPDVPDEPDELVPPFELFEPFEPLLEPPPLSAPLLDPLPPHPTTAKRPTTSPADRQLLAIMFIRLS